MSGPGAKISGIPDKIREKISFLFWNLCHNDIRCLRLLKRPSVSTSLMYPISCDTFETTIFDEADIATQGRSQGPRSANTACGACALDHNVLSWSERQSLKKLRDCISQLDNGVSTWEKLAMHPEISRDGQGSGMFSLFAGQIGTWSVPFAFNQSTCVWH